MTHFLHGEMVGRKTLVVNWTKILELSAIDAQVYISLWLRTGHRRLNTVLTVLQVWASTGK